MIKSMNMPGYVSERHRKKKNMSTLQKRKIEKLFSVLSTEIRGTSGGSTESFKGRLDGWLKKIPDQPKAYVYGRGVCLQRTTVL